MSEKKFNLIDEPWILVLDDKGETQEVSILEFFEKAHTFKCFAGELPTQDVAILRMLLAVVYSVFTNVDENGEEVVLETEKEALSQWKSLWDRGAFSCEPIRQYLEYYRENFFLIHPDTPFFQVAGLHNAKGEFNSLTQIIGDVPNRPERQFFSNRGLSSTNALPYDEAARWLVHLQNWDCAGIKAHIVGGTHTGGDTGWLGKFGVVFLEGRNLFETILYNYVLDDGQFIEVGTPTWETPCQNLDKQQRYPRGYVELLTWQSRRVLLFDDGRQIEGCLFSHGDVCERENLFAEQMCGWSRKSGSSKGLSPFLPKILRKERLLWRDFSALLPLNDSTENSERRPPGVVSWRGCLRRNEICDSDLANISVVGYEYGTQNSSIHELMTDRISFNVDFLTRVGNEWLPQISSVLEKTEAGVVILKTLVEELDKASGGDDKRVKSKSKVPDLSSIEGTAFSALDAPFRTWLASIDPVKDDPDEMCLKWCTEAKDIIFRIGKNLVAQCAPNALVWRKQRKDAPTAFLDFRKKLFRVMSS